MISAGKIERADVRRVTGCAIWQLTVSTTPLEKSK